jgi:prepilin-type processing-associated H-X9-DG protein
VAMTDLIYDWESIAHRIGAQPKSLDILWGDGHVKASSTLAAFSYALWGSNPSGLPGGNDAGDSNGQFNRIISFLEP